MAPRIDCSWAQLDVYASKGGTNWTRSKARPTAVASGVSCFRSSSPRIPHIVRIARPSRKSGMPSRLVTQVRTAERRGEGKRGAARGRVRRKLTAWRAPACPAGQETNCGSLVERLRLIRKHRWYARIQEGSEHREPGAKADGADEAVGVE